MSDVKVNNHDLTNVYSIEAADTDDTDSSKRNYTLAGFDSTGLLDIETNTVSKVQTFDKKDIGFIWYMKRMQHLDIVVTSNESKVHQVRILVESKLVHTLSREALPL